jgi:glutathione S-transferase
VALTLYYHPFSSFCQKVLIALYEGGIAFEPHLVDLGDAESRAAFEQLWPLAKFPVLRDEGSGLVLPESSVIIDYLAQRFPAAASLIPAEPEAALRARMLDRIFDGYVSMQLTKVVIDALRPDGGKDPIGVEQAKATIATAYDWLDRELPEGGWAVGEGFTLADCSAAPALFYANIAVPFAGHPRLEAYYARLRARPSFDRAVEEARPYRPIFPLGWPADYD